MHLWFHNQETFLRYIFFLFCFAFLVQFFIFFILFKGFFYIFKHIVQLLLFVIVSIQRACLFLWEMKKATIIELLALCLLIEVFPKQFFGFVEEGCMRICLNLDNWSFIDMLLDTIFLIPGPVIFWNFADLLKMIGSGE